jgi:hypothetical protein
MKTRFANFAQIDYPVPPWSQAAGNTEQDWDDNVRSVLTSSLLPTPLEDMRLVIKHNDKDVIVDKMHIPAKYTKIDGLTERPLRRWIAGTDVEIPTPEYVEEDPEKTYYTSDTFKDTVDQETHVPFLDQPPFPQSIINELRNPRSKSSSRIPLQVVEKLLRKDERAEVKKEAARGLMLDTPATEAAKRETKALREAKPELFDNEAPLTAETVNVLAQYMSKHLFLGGQLPDLDARQQAKKPTTKVPEKKGISKRWGVPKFHSLPKNDEWRAKPGKMARRTVKVKANKNFEKAPLRIRRKEDKAKRYDLRPRR